MEMGRTIVIGDIHGCFDELVSLLGKLQLALGDRVVGVGDLIVKGPKNREVLDLFREDTRFSSVVGNHDLALIRFWRGDQISLKTSQRRAAEELERGRDKYLEYFRAQCFFLDLGTHVVVHAGLRPGVPLDQQSIEDLTELRTLGPDRTSREGTPWFDLYDGEKVVLFGHWPMSEPRRAKRAIGLDTGCVYGYSLTAYIIETGEFVSVRAREAYDQPQS
jgi:diadenosine tetraphosphatase ApaH/serine/threonine PP2A family protein phosphatase